MLIVRSKHIFLNLFVLDFPVTAITSILHRLTGLFLFVSIPFILYFFKLSVESESSFNVAQILISQIHIKVFLVFLYLAFLYHLFNGLKHIIMDIGYFDSKSAARQIAIVFLIITGFFFILSILL